jgi:hypothetical protein
VSSNPCYKTAKTPCTSSGVCDHTPYEHLSRRTNQKKRHSLSSGTYGGGRQSNKVDQSAAQPNPLNLVQHRPALGIQPSRDSVSQQQSKASQEKSLNVERPDVGMNTNWRVGKPHASSTRRQSVISAGSDDSSESQEKDDQMPASLQARLFLQLALQSDVSMETRRRQVLESAVDFASQLTPAKAPPPDAEGVSQNTDFAGGSKYPSAEALHYILTGKLYVLLVEVANFALESKKNIASSFHMDISAVISRSTFERMGFALIDGTVSGHMKFQYIACVNAVAYLFMIAVCAEGHTPEMQDRLQGLTNQYLVNLTAALHRISVLDPPSLNLLQALLSGVSATLPEI